MITIDEKLYVTKEINNVVEKYAREIVLRRFLNEFSFENANNHQIKISSLLEETSSCDGDEEKPSEIEIHLQRFLSGFLEKCSPEDLTALYFWMININYLDYLNIAQDEDPDPVKNESHENEGFRFGRDIAYKLYDPESTGLNLELCEKLQDLITSYSAEFDLSLVDKYTIDHINETIDYYCSVLLLD